MSTDDTMVQSNLTKLLSNLLTAEKKEQRAASPLSINKIILKIMMSYLLCELQTSEEDKLNRALQALHKIVYHDF